MALSASGVPDKERDEHEVEAGGHEESQAETAGPGPNGQEQERLMSDEGPSQWGNVRLMFGPDRHQEQGHQTAKHGESAEDREASLLGGPELHLIGRHQDASSHGGQRSVHSQPGWDTCWLVTAQAGRPSPRWIVQGKGRCGKPRSATDFAEEKSRRPTRRAGFGSLTTRSADSPQARSSKNVARFSKRSRCRQASTILLRWSSVRAGVARLWNLATSSSWDMGFFGSPLGKSTRAA